MHQLSDELRELLITGAFAPGSRLSEHDLALELGVSRNTLRETFRALAEQGLVEHLPHRGVFVTTPTVAGVADIYRVRTAIEVAAMRGADPAHDGVGRMRRAIEDADAFAALEDWLTVGTANMAFHEAIVGLADSPRLSRSYRNVAAELRVAFLAVDDAQTLHEPFVAQNHTVLDAFVASGPEAGAIALQEYLHRSEGTMLDALRAGGFA